MARPLGRSESERWADRKAYAVRCWLGCKRQPFSNMHTGKRFAALDTSFTTSSLPHCAREVEHCCLNDHQTKSSPVKSTPVKVHSDQLESSHAMHSTCQPAVNNKHQTIAANSYDSASRLPPRA